MNIVASRWDTVAKRANYKNKIIKFFLHYLETIVKDIDENNNLVKNKHTPFAGAFLKEIGKNIYYANVTIAQCIIELKAISNNPALLKDMCLSFISEFTSFSLTEHWKKDTRQLHTETTYLIKLPLSRKEVVASSVVVGETMKSNASRFTCT